MHTKNYEWLYSGNWQSSTCYIFSAAFEIRLKPSSMSKIFANTVIICQVLDMIPAMKTQLSGIMTLH